MLVLKFLPYKMLDIAFQATQIVKTLATSEKYSSFRYVFQFYP